MVATPRPQLPTPASNPMIPPEGTVWEQYSPNGESVLSGLASFMVHLFVLLVIITGLVGVARPDVSGPVEFIPVSDGDGAEGGGDGRRENNGPAPGTPQAAADVVRPLEAKVIPQRSTIDEPKVQKDAGPTITDDPLAEHLARKFQGRPEFAGVVKALKELDPKLNGPGAKGNDGGDGKGNKPGNGVGNKDGNRTGPRSARAARMQRWELVFTTNDARHYLQQLDALGAVVAVADSAGHFLTIRNLKERPARPQAEDLGDLHRIYWVDDRRDSTESVAAELGLDSVPTAIVAFFPQSLEQELLRKELAYEKRAEADIEFTKFSISFSAGRHVIRVIEQQPRVGRK